MSPRAWVRLVRPGDDPDQAGEVAVLRARVRDLDDECELYAARLDRIRTATAALLDAIDQGEDLSVAAAVVRAALEGR